MPWELSANPVAFGRSGAQVFHLAVGYMSGGRSGRPRHLEAVQMTALTRYPQGRIKLDRATPLCEDAIRICRYCSEMAAGHPNEPAKGP